MKNKNEIEQKKLNQNETRFSSFYFFYVKAIVICILLHLYRLTHSISHVSVFLLFVGGCFHFCFSYIIDSHVEYSISSGIMRFSQIKFLIK